VRRFCQDAPVTAVLGAIASVALAALIAAAAWTLTPLLLAAAVGVAVVVLAVGWASLLDLPAPRGSAVAVLLIGLGGAVVALQAGAMTRPLAPFAALLALAVLLAFGHELLRRHGRPHLVESLTGTMAAEAVALLGAGWVLLPGTKLGLTAVAAVAAAVVGVRLAALLPIQDRVAGWVAFVAGAVFGTAGGVLVDPARYLPVALLSLGVSAVAAGLDRLLQRLPTMRGAAATLSASAAPVLAVGTVAYVLDRLVF
jgi:hypothetical protein